MASLAEEYPQEQERCRELLAAYKELGPVGAFGAMNIENALREADQAAVSGDVVAMIIAYEKMRGCE